MKCAHSIKLTVFSYASENSQLVLDAFLMFFPFDLEENKVTFRKTNANGFNESKIEIMEATLTKPNLISQFLNNLLKNLDAAQKNSILQQAESRLDKNLDFFLKFDKNSWINGKKLVLTDSGKCFHIKISIAAFPKKREIALNIIRDLFSKS